MMIGAALFALMSGAAAEFPPPPNTPIYEVQFAPLVGSERNYLKDGPAGPYYPRAAWDDRANGDAILLCRAAEGGVLEQCKALAETPSGYSFGVAARIMANRKRVTAIGSPPPGQMIYVHVPFVLAVPAKIDP